METFLERIARVLTKHKVPFAIVGGYAVALHGVTRGTIDIDLITKFRAEVFIKLEAALKSIGLIPRLPVTAKEVFNFREEYIKNRNLIAWSFYNPKVPFEVLDVIITWNLEKVKVVKKNIRGQIIPVIGIEDLIKMKRESDREQDKFDVKALQEIS